MLTKEHALFTFDRFEVRADCLTRVQHARYREMASKLLYIYHHGRGLTRRDLHRRSETVFTDEADCPPQRVRAFVKLLDDVSEFETDREGRAAELRRRVFELAALRHPLVRRPDRLFESAEGKVKADIANQLAQPWRVIESSMHRDFPEFHRLQVFHGYRDADALLNRYNVAQAQVLLFWAEEMTITARSDLKMLFRYAKLAGLLHEVTAVAPSVYRIRLTGPVFVLKQTRRYGVNFAQFLPALLACRDWQMQAKLHFGKFRSFLRISSESGLRSFYKPEKEFDSALEEKFARKFGTERDGWKLERETEALVKGQKVFLPDFVFRHQDGAVVYFEIVGYWTPEYLAAKWKTLAMFADRLILVSVSKPLALSQENFMPPGTLTHGRTLQLAQVLERLKQVRERKGRNFGGGDSLIPSAPV